MLFFLAVYLTRKEKQLSPCFDSLPPNNKNLAQNTKVDHFIESGGKEDNENGVALEILTVNKLCMFLKEI